MGHKESDMTEWLTLSQVKIFKTTILNILPKINNWERGLAIVAALYSLAGLWASIQVVRDHGDWWWPKAILLVYLFLKSWVPVGCSLWALDSLCCAVLGRSVVSDSFDPMNWSPPGSSVQGILQARTLEWVVMPSSRWSSQPRDWTQVSCITDRFWATRDSLPVAFWSMLCLSVFFADSVRVVSHIESGKKQGHPGKPWRHLPPSQP